ncbi:TetR family transcriptional regulator [Rhodococcus sp. NPDC047139]|uniref:TetR/AcrR family transcriptional regulator n=1 Tax=Rhodococcus sp. NPDC047139 TaxID=3155141 RepID=UPI0034038F83
MRQESSELSRTSTESAVGRRRGRPSVIDTEAIAEAAYDLWSRQGYADTSWNDLAEATGISARTLIRHFSAKSAIAWIGVDPATERLRASLSAASETAPLTDAVRAAIVESVSHRPHIQRVGPDWLRLIAGTPELAAMASEAYQPWITELAGYIGRRVPEVPAAIARALATAYQAAAFAALTEWAQEGAHGDPADAVDAMLRWMDIVPRSSARSA